MKRFITNKYFLYLVGLILFLLIWELLSLIIDDQTLIFPGPFVTFIYSFSLFGSSYLYGSILETLIRMFIGFGISFLLAFIIGLIAGNYDNFYNLIKPAITILKAVPTACLVFLFLVLTGTKNAPIFIVILISFPILFEAIYSGFKNIDPNIINATRIDGATFLNRQFRIKLPLALPYIMVGIASSFSLSFKIEIMSEILTGNTTDGLGAIISYYQKLDPSNLVPIFAYGLIAVIIILIFDLINIVVKNKFKFIEN